MPACWRASIPPAYYKRVRTFLREYQLPQVRTPVGFVSIRAFVGSTFSLGVVGRERWQYWRLIAWTMLRRPSMLPMAVRLRDLWTPLHPLCLRSSGLTRPVASYSQCHPSEPRRAICSQLLRAVVLITEQPRQRVLVTCCVYGCSCSHQLTRLR